MVDAAKVQSFADRVLALKAQEDEIKKEIREVYAEAVEDEIDKTGLGQLVTHLRKRGKAPEDFDAKEAIFLGYLELYNVAFARTHAYARARTGEIIEGNEPASSEAQVRSERSGEGGEAAPALSADTQSQPGRSEAPRQIEAGLVAKVEDQSTAARTDVRDSTEGIAAPQPLNPEAATTPPAAGRSPVDTHPEPGNGEAGASPAPAPEPAAEGTAHNPIPSAVPGNMQNLHNAPGSIRTERTHTEGVERHQFAVWPEYQGRAHADLVDDVRTNGVREPIVMQGRIILDGWARYLAAREAGVSYPVQEYAGDDPLADIIAWNMASRNPNLLERQAIHKKLIKLVPDRADEIAELLDLQQVREAAQ